MKMRTEQVLQKRLATTIPALWNLHMIKEVDHLMAAAFRGCIAG